jgi:hypothetical protein
MQLDPSNYLRLDVPHSLGATAAGAAFATSSEPVYGLGVYFVALNMRGQFNKSQDEE